MMKQSLAPTKGVISRWNAGVWRAEKPATPNIWCVLCSAPEGVVTPDIAGKLPGRGVWVSADIKSLEKAIAQKSFARGFKSQAKIEGGLVDLTGRLLARRVLGLVTMARKSGVIALGFDQVQSMAREAAIAFRIEAKDGSKDGRGKIRTLSKAVNREQDLADPIVVGCFTAEEIGKALARESIVHAAIKPCKLAKVLAIDVKKTIRVSGVNPSRLA